MDRHRLKLLSAPRRETQSCPRGRQLWPSTTHCVCSETGLCSRVRGACWGCPEGESMPLSLCSLHTTLQKGFRSWRLPGWGPFGVESTARLPSELGFMISHRGQVAAKSLLRWVKSSKPFSIPHPRAVAPQVCSQDKEGTPQERSPHLCSRSPSCGLSFIFPILFLLLLPLSCLFYAGN